MVNEILVLREIIEKSCNFVKELHHVYLNFKYFPRELRNIFVAWINTCLKNSLHPSTHFSHAKLVKERATIVPCCHSLISLTLLFFPLQMEFLLKIFPYSFLSSALSPHFFSLVKY
jgi:hypothetical protein